MPILKAKGEAEALCAQLNREGLVDACITADSDAFLYGAQCVVKRIQPNSKVSALSCDFILINIYLMNYSCLLYYIDKVNYTEFMFSHLVEPLRRVLIIGIEFSILRLNLAVAKLGAYRTTEWPCICYLITFLAMCKMLVRVLASQSPNVAYMNA